MVRCSKCEKSYKQHTGKCWIDGICNKCMNSPDAVEITYFPPRTYTRTLHIELDHYLDLYTWQEIRQLQG